MSKKKKINRLEMDHEDCVDGWIVSDRHVDWTRWAGYAESSGLHIYEKEKIV